MIYLPDQAYIERIKDALWQGGEFGRAAVLVGAGLSLNARPLSTATPPFPTWRALTGRMVEELYPEHVTSGVSREEALDQSKSTSGALRLADEYQAAFGRDALDRLVLAAVPDLSYEPATVHSLLLALPWSDVFTTNYDTLLERSSRGILERKYDVVRTIQEIPGSSRPRIIKLHGSFPSNRPFIISEEDFRTYPRSFAPFVNLAQESMMENAFCLLGFSGDDPNFLHWSGWVRDNLGRNSPTIYLCGILALNDAKRKLLADRNVIPIDLSLAVPSGNRNRHGLALEWFLRVLGDRGSWPTPKQWPYRESESRFHSATSAGFPSGSHSEFQWFSNEELVPAGAGARLSDEAIHGLLAKWATTRKSYPGWVVAPTEIRDRVWMYTDFWIPGLVERQNDASIGILLRLLFELNWRLEICLVPLWPELANSIVACVERINPYAGPEEIPGTQLNPNDESLKLLDGEEVRYFWLELALACLRFYRESQDIKHFDIWASRLESIAEGMASLRSRICYQRCLLGLGRLDHEAVRSSLSDWVGQEEEPFWLIRQAAVFVELGDLAEAGRRADKGLNSIRASLIPGSSDIGMLSREGWAMKLALVIRQAKSNEPLASEQNLRELERNFRGRWRSLVGFDCDPDGDLRLLEERLKRAKPAPTTETRTQFAFDLSERTTSIRAGGPSPLAQLLPAVQAFRLIEEAAYPLRCSVMKLMQDQIRIAVTWARDSYPAMSTSYLLRLADRHLLSDHLNRNLIAVLPDEEVLDLHGMLTTHLEYGIKVLANSLDASTAEVQLTERALIEICIELLSMVVFRLPQTMLLSEIGRAVRYYKSAIFTPFTPDIRILDRLFLRSMRSLVGLRAETLHSLSIDLLSLPIPGVEGFPAYGVSVWPDPSRHLERFSLDGARESDPRRWKQLVEWLLRVTSDQHGPSRFVASLRLVILWEKGVLEHEELGRFSSALWAKCDPQTGLPTGTALNYSYLLNLPEPKPGLSARLLKRFCLKTALAELSQTVTLPSGLTAKSQLIGVDPGLFLDVIVSISLRQSAKVGHRRPRVIKFDEKDGLAVFETIASWWRTEGKSLCAEGKSFMDGEPIMERHKRVVRVVRTTLLSLCRVGDALSSRIKDLLFELDGVGLPVLSALLPLTRLFPTLRPEVVERTRLGLASLDQNTSEDAMGVLYNWVAETSPGGIGPPPPELLNSFSSLISLRVRSSLFWALVHARNMIEQAPDDVRRQLMPNLLLGLEFLLEESMYRRFEELGKSPLPADQIPVIRFRAAALAVSINRIDRSAHTIIKKWMDAIPVDPVPEVRALVQGLDADLDL